MTERRAACIACRRLKIRCLSSDKVDSDTCRRCQSVGETCSYDPNKRRGRPPVVINPARPHSITAPSVASNRPTAVLPSTSSAIRSTDEGVTTSLRLDPLSEPQRAQLDFVPDDDPISIGLLTLIEARQLITLFHRHLNPLIGLLDPSLHDTNFLRQYPCLLSSVLAAASKFFRADLNLSLSAHAKRLVDDALSCGQCTPAVVQSLLIRVYWKAPTDSTAWLRIGEAIRLGLQMRWHVLRTKALPSDEYQSRLVLASERTWICLFLFDYTYSMSFDLPRMIHETQIPRIRDWLAMNKPFTTQTDHHLGISVEGTLLSADWKFATSGYRGSQEQKMLVRDMEDRYWRLMDDWLGPENLQFALHPVEQNVLSWILLQQHFDMQSYLYANDHGDKDSFALSRVLGAISRSVEATERVAADGTLRFVQDVASVVLAGLIQFIRNTFLGMTVIQQTDAVDCLKRLYKACHECDEDENSAPRYIARHIHRVLAGLQQVSRQASPVRPPAPEVPQDWFTFDINDLGDLGGLPDLAEDEAYWSTVFAQFGSWSD